MTEWKMKIIATEDNYYLIAPDGVDMKRILNMVCEHTGMRKGSFADLEVQEIFSDLFRCAVNLKYSYRKYYIEEYDSFREFLYQKETMEYEQIDSMNLQDDDTLWELRDGVNRYGIKDIIGYENENILMLNRFLEGIKV